MKVQLGIKGLRKTWQDDFPLDTPCCRCDGTARIGFVAHEIDQEGPHVCEMYDNEYSEGRAWLHDCCAVAVYFCKKCLETTALYNQA